MKAKIIFGRDWYEDKVGEILEVKHAPNHRGVYKAVHSTGYVIAYDVYLIDEWEYFKEKMKNKEEVVII